MLLCLGSVLVYPESRRPAFWVSTRKKLVLGHGSQNSSCTALVGNISLCYRSVLGTCPITFYVPGSESLCSLACSATGGQNGLDEKTVGKGIRPWAWLQKTLAQCREDSGSDGLE